MKLLPRNWPRPLPSVVITVLKNLIFMKYAVDGQNVEETITENLRATVAVPYEI
jgi:hypothetical protein